MRLYTIEQLLAEQKKLPFLFTDLANICYLTGFGGSYGYLLVAEEGVWFITDSRYAQYAASLFKDENIGLIIQKKNFTEDLKQIAAENKWKSLFLEDETVTVAQQRTIASECQIETQGGGNPTEALRLIKSESELAIMQQAARITDECTAHLFDFIKPGMTEWDVVTEMTHFYMKRGCSGTSFDPIVASGTGSSMPHYKTGEKIISEGDVLLIDMGCVYKGYNSDLTRTFFVSYIDPELERVYHVVNEARRKAVEAARPGISAGELDSVARNHIADAGYGDYFGHSLGHGVGLDVHEAPRIKPEGDAVLRPGTVITIEPGIYLPGKGGVRIEDMIVITEESSKLMTQYPRDIQIIDSSRR